MVCVLAACKMRPPEKLNDVMNLIVAYNQVGRHDDAIKVAQDWMKNHPDDLLYDQIAITCLMKASKDSAQKDQWIQQAVANYEKDLSTRKKAAVDVELYEVGRGFEYAGDLSSHASCLYYSRAMKAFEEEVQFIQGDSYTAYGHTTPLAPVRQENQKALERVKSKFDKAGCKAESSQSSSPG
jgi:tetratricopeptide (TPR) repeat protein